METSKLEIHILLLFTGGNGFPIGDAYTNRILAIAKGLKLNGCKVTILILYPGKNNTVGETGTFEGVQFIFMSGLKRPISFLHRKYVGIKGIINAVFFLLNSNNPKVDYILTFSQSFIQNFPIYLVSHIRNIGFFRENNEFPMLVLNRGNCNLYTLEKLFFRFVNSIYTGFIFISSKLKEFNQSLINSNSPIEIVPIVVDIDRFIFPQKSRVDEITYCGNLFGEKDGVKILLQAFAKISHKHKTFKLVLIGDISDIIEYNKLKELITELKITDKVEFTGFLNRSQVPAQLVQSSLLVLARPDNIQAKGGFPTKLGEYLASGRPVLVTAVGDIPLYITHGKNGFLAIPGSVDDFSSKMDEILSNYEKAAEVGQEGKKLTLTDFNNVFQAKRILEFMKQTMKRKL